MASQIVTKLIILGSLVLASGWAQASAIENVETQDIIAQLKAMYEVEGGTSERCEHLVMNRPHYKKVLNLLEAKKHHLEESNRQLASLGFFTVFSAGAGEVADDQLKSLEEAEKKYGCLSFRQSRNMIPRQGTSLEH